MRRARQFAQLDGMTIDDLAVTDLLAYWRDGHGAKGE